MKILHTVEFYYPNGGGMYEVVRQLSERLVNFGYDLTVATRKLPENSQSIINGVKIKEFDLAGNFITGIKGEIKKYQEFLKNSNFEIITNFAAQQPLTDLALPILDKIKAKKVFVPTGFSAFYMKEYKDYFERMKKWMRQYDMNVFLSDNYRDVNFAQQNGITKMTLITNGADEREFLFKSNIAIREKLGISKDYFLILHVGSHTGVKGHQEAIEIFTKAKIKNVFFLINGKGSAGCFNSCKRKERKLNDSKNFKLSNKKLILKDLNRKELVAAYQEADLFLFPSNIECSPIVLFEAMASKTPFLVTDVGNSVEIIKWSNGGMLLPTKKGIALDISLSAKLKEKVKKILKHFGRPYLGADYHFSKAKIEESIKILEFLYNNPKKRDKLAREGYKSWLEKFTWEKITKDYERVYKKLTAV